MQDLEIDGPNLRAGKCKTWKMTDHVAGGGKCRT